MRDLNRVESALVAISKGLGSEWATDYITSMGWAGRVNKLGAALVHLDGHRTGANKNLVKQLLAAELLHMKLETNGSMAWDAADDAVEWYLTKWCPSCNGAGQDFNQVQCPVCEGRRERAKPGGVRQGVALIEASLEWLDAQLGRFNRAATQAQHKDAPRYSGPMEEGPEQGWRTFATAHA